MSSEVMPEPGPDYTQQFNTIVVPGSPVAQSAVPASDDAPWRHSAPVAAPPTKKTPVALYAAGAAVAAIVLFGGFLMASGNGGDGDDGTSPAAIAASATAEATQGLGIAPTAEPAQLPPDRTNCDEIRGTPYRSLTEQTWFNENCLPPAAVPTSAPPPAAVPPVAPTTAPPTVVPAPPVTAASYSVFGFSDSATAGSDPPASTVGSGATLRSCNPGVLYAWVDYGNAPTPAGYTGRWFRGSSLINETSFTQTVPAGRMFWSVGAPLPPDTYRFEVLQGGTRVTGGSVTLVC